MKKVVFVVLATLWLFACKKEDGKKVEFRALPFSSIVSDTLEIDSVRMNTFFSNPTSLFTIDDSLILVFDDNRSDKLCHFMAHPTNPVECCADANPKTMLPNDT